MTLLLSARRCRPRLYFPPVPIIAPDSSCRRSAPPPTAAALSFHQRQNKLTGALPSDLSPLKAIDQIDMCLLLGIAMCLLLGIAVDQL
jgi:hypothetical protein